jgi:hypothetical protein
MGERLYNVDMYCLGCSYALVGLEESRCPECGRVFDPADLTTYSAKPDGGKRARDAKWVERVLISAGLVPLCANAMGFVALIGARVHLGRWPHRMGWDDPKDLGWVYELTLLSMLLLVASFPALLLVIMLSIYLAATGVWERLLRGGLIAISVWVCGFVLLRFDPAQVWLWMFD